MNENPVTLLKILEQLISLPGETHTVEFKVDWQRPETVGEYISALANAAVLARHDRGWIVWGINNQTQRIEGTTFKPSTARAEGNQPLIMWLTQLIFPRPDFQFHELIHQQRRVVMLEIHPPRTAPLAFKNIRYIRIGSHTTKLSNHPDKEARIWEILGRQEDWSGHIVPEASLADLDAEAVKFARARFMEYLIKNESDTNRHDKIRSDVLSWDVLTLLNKAHITKQGRLTRSALLLLGRDEATHLLAPADVKISWILNSPNHPLTGLHFGMPLLLAPEKLFKHIRNITIEYMPDGTLFSVPVSQYDQWVIREALHNCIAHQDYQIGAKTNVVEYPDRLVFTNLGVFIPKTVENMLEQQAPPEYYRNRWLIEGMIRLRMIDQIGSGIRRMFETQRDRFFPLPDYIIDSDPLSLPRVEVTIHGKILDVNYSKILINRHDLDLFQVIWLDRVQKHQPVPPVAVKRLRSERLIEGRAPNYYISAKVAEWTGQKARYIRNRGLDDIYYRQLIMEYLQQYKKASRKDLDDLLLPKLPEVLSIEQKQTKVRNLIQSLRRSGKIQNSGSSNKNPLWELAK